MADITEPTPLYRMAEAAERLGVTEAWLRKQVQKKLVRHTRLSERMVRFSAEDIAAIIEAAKKDPESKPESKPTRQRARRAS